MSRERGDRTAAIVFISRSEGTWHHADGVPATQDFFDATDLRQRCVLEGLSVARRHVSVRSREGLNSECPLSGRQMSSLSDRFWPTPVGRADAVEVDTHARINNY